MMTKRQEQIIVNRWAALLRDLKRNIGDEYRCMEGDRTPGMLVTFGLSTSGNWSYQTGDNSYTGGAYGYAHWGLAYLYRRSNCKELAQLAFDEATEQMDWQATGEKPRSMYLEDIARKRENYKMDLWGFGS